jgi:CDP-paratose 2-epimerase
VSAVLITGGAGFIGSNLAHRLVGEGHEVTIYDDLSRPGARRNLEWLLAEPGPTTPRLVQGDLRDFDLLRRAADGAQRIYHLAGQVAVTTSVADPRADFESNALGTFNALEAARQTGDNPIFLYSSTNKVYGGMEGVRTVEEASRYRYADLPDGVSEEQPLDFHSPYGCSKGAGDQYTRDYHRIYGLRTVVLRQSCIYGYRQFGQEDQGWVAWFVIAAVGGVPLTIYGDGKQVRDLLFIDDLLEAYEAAIERIERSAGQIYNIGGGPQNTVSIWAELGPLLERLLERRLEISYDAWRPGDQRIFVSDIRKARRELGWEPRVGVEEGVRRLLEWVRVHRELFRL